MSITAENLLLIGSLLLLIGIFTSKTSFRIGLPALLLFLFVGMLAGSEGIGKIHFNDPGLAQFIGIVSLNFILFSGGFDTSWKTTKPVLWSGVTLSTVGVLLTAITLGIFIWLVTDFTIYEGLLLGSIVSSTDAAAVFSILRSKSVALKSKLRPMLELESGSNDPMAYVLTIAFLGLVQSPEQGILSIIPLFFQQMLLGAVAGYLFGRISKFVINKIKLDYEGLYPVLVIALMFITFSATDSLGGNGFLAVYLFAIYLGNQELIHKKAILKMFDGLAWLMQIVLFITLGLLVFPSEVIHVAGIGILISLFLIFIARPVAVFLCLLPFKMEFRKKLYVSWVGLRGAVPIVFATYPLIAGVEKAHMIFNIVFFISFTSVLIQGTTLSKVAKWLHVALPEKVKQSTPVDMLITEHERALMREILIPPGSYPVMREIIDLHFPQSAIIAMIKRDEKFITPNGSTIIEANDTLIVLSDSEQGLQQVYDTLKIDNPIPFTN